MDTAFFCITLILSAVAALVSLTRQFQMLQLNSYYNRRYLRWLGTAFSPASALSAGASVVACFFLLLPWYVAALCVALLSLIIRTIYIVLGQQKAKKRLVFTARVKRMVATAILLLAAGCAAAHVLPFAAGRLMGAVVVLMPALSPLLAMLVNLLNRPVEKAVAGWYVRDAKRRLANMKDLRVIGITGSYGKTSTKYILGRLLSEKYNVLITPESFNTSLGVVRTVREHLRPHTEIFIAEMGAKRRGDIREICDIVHPSLGMITAVGPQHLDTFKTLETVALTKLELADSVARQGGRVFLSTESPALLQAAGAYPSATYGLSEGGTAWAEKIVYGRFGARFDICSANRRIAVESRLLGRHNVLNIVGAAAVAMELGLTDTQIRFAVSQLESVPHRLELKPFYNGSLLIDDAFNANPEGSLEAVRVLGSFEGYKKIVVTPGLVELGEREYECNRTLGLTMAEFCDEIYLVGVKRAQPLADGVKSTLFAPERLHIKTTFLEALESIRPDLDANTVVLFLNDLPDNYAR